MSEEKNVIKSLTIQKLPETIINQFHESRQLVKKTPAQFFTFMMEHLGTQFKNPSNIDSNDQIIELRVVNTQMREHIENITKQLQECQEKAPIEVEKKLTGTQFIFEPKDETAKNMKRAILFLIKEGKAKKDSPDLLENFTENAVKYYIKNEFNHILK